MQFRLLRSWSTPAVLQLRGIQFNYQTPYTMGGNFTIQYQLTPTMSVQAGYVTSLARHLESFPGSNNPTSIAAQNTPESTLVPFPDFGDNASYAATGGMSAYHSLQTKVEKQFSNGLNFLFTYTFSKTMTDAGDLLNGGSVGNVGFRAPNVPGLGMPFDYGLADFDIRNVFHFSGGYELPFGKGKRFTSDASGSMNQLVGGWSVQWSTTLQGGQPIALGCPSGTASNLGCGDLYTGQPLDLGLHTDANGLLSYFGNPAAFTQPCVLGASGVPIAESARRLRSSDWRRRFGWRNSGGRPRIPPTWTSRSSRTSTINGALPSAVPYGSLQHLQPPELQRPELRRQRCCGHLQLGQLQQFDLRRNRLDSRCSLRSAADPVRSEAVLLTLTTPNPRRACRRAPFAVSVFRRA